MAKLILALDVSKTEAKNIIDEVSEYVDCFKVGSILYTEVGYSLIEYIKNYNKEVFLDLKFFDIPNTVKGVSKVVAEFGVDMFTIHLLGGKEMIKASLEGIKQSGAKKLPLILGVTVLTSMNEKILKEELKISLSVEEMVLHLATMGYQTGIRGFVCSPQEIRLLKENLPRDITVVTPGIRLLEDNWQDQKRVMTPGRAKELGADYIVVGRSVLDKENRLEILKKIKDELE